MKKARVTAVKVVEKKMKQSRLQTRAAIIQSRLIIASLFARTRSSSSCRFFSCRMFRMFTSTGSECAIVLVGCGSPSLAKPSSRMSSGSILFRSSLRRDGGAFTTPSIGASRSHTILLTLVDKCKKSRLCAQGAALPENNEASAELTTANGGTLLRAQPDSVANRVTARSISDRRALTWLATKTGWARNTRAAICSGKLISGYMISYDVIEVRHLKYICIGLWLCDNMLKLSAHLLAINFKAGTSDYAFGWFVLVDFD